MCIFKHYISLSSNLQNTFLMISDRGHKDETVKIKRMLTNKNLQALLFSATYEEAVLNFANAIIKDANKITLRREEESLDCIQQFFVKTSSNDDKMTALKNIYWVRFFGVFCDFGLTAGQVLYARMNRIQITFKYDQALFSMASSEEDKPSCSANVEILHNMWVPNYRF